MELREWLEQQVKMCESKIIFWDGSRQAYENMLKGLLQPEVKTDDGQPGAESKDPE